MSSTGRLSSVRHGHDWSDGTNTARCTLGRHAAPSADCGCGFTAYGSAFWGRSEWLANAEVWGVIECWGRIVVGPNGLRAEKARIIGLWVAAGVGEDVRELVRTTYRSADLYRSREDLLRAHPLSRLPGYRTPPAARPAPQSRGAEQRARTGVGVGVGAGLAEPPPRLPSGIAGLLVIAAAVVMPWLAGLFHAPPDVGWALVGAVVAVGALAPRRDGTRGSPPDGGGGRLRGRRPGE